MDSFKPMQTINLSTTCTLFGLSQYVTARYLFLCFLLLVHYKGAKKLIFFLCCIADPIDVQHLALMLFLFLCVF